MRPVLAPPLGRTGGELSRARGEQRGQSNSPLKGVEQSGDRGHWGAVRRGAMTPRDLARSRSGVALATPAPASPPRITRSPTCERLRGRGADCRAVWVMPEPRRHGDRRRVGAGGTRSAPVGQRRRRSGTFQACLTSQTVFRLKVLRWSEERRRLFTETDASPIWQTYRAFTQ